MQFKILKGQKLIHGIADSLFGSMREGNENSIKFLRSIGVKPPLQKRLIWAEEVFGTKVYVCKPDDSGVIKGVDGLISKNPGQILGVITADCAPILFFDPKQRVVAILHGSRKSLTEGIIQNVVKKMLSNFDSNPKDILVGIGPHIHVCHYWLKSRAYKSLKDTRFRKYFIKKGNKIYFDLSKLIFEELRKLGILKKNIENCEICTFHTYKKYFSARKQEESPGVYKETKPNFGSFIGL